MAIRTTFPSTVDFSGWWIRSKKGIVAQLDKITRDLHGYVEYSLTFSNGQTGNGRYTMEELIENGVVIRHLKKDIISAERKQKAPPTQSRTITR